MMPAALSLLTTSFSSGSDRPKALGVWGGVGGLASAVGVFLGGLLTEGPGWRWVLEVNPPIALLLLVGIFALIPADGPVDRTQEFDLTGALLITGSMLTLVFALVKAPDQGWSDARTVSELAAAAVLLLTFIVVELRSHSPLVPLAVFRLPGLAAADVTQLVGVGGFVTMFFFITLYMENVLHFSPLQTGSAYLPLAFMAGVSAGIGTALIGRIGTRPVMVAGALVTAVGLFLLSRIPVDGSYLTDLLPGMLVVAAGIGAVFVGTTTAANAGVPPSLAGLAAALVNSSQQIGGALGLAVLSAIATSRTHRVLADGHPLPDAMTQGFHRALLAAAIFLLAAAVVALRTRNTRGEHAEEELTAAVGIPQMS
jgi:MFS family permease